jgi:hypothetical protein
MPKDVALVNTSVKVVLLEELSQQDLEFIMLFVNYLTRRLSLRRLDLKIRVLLDTHSASKDSVTSVTGLPNSSSRTVVKSQLSLKEIALSTRRMDSM